MSQLIHGEDLQVTWKYSEEEKFLPLTFPEIWIKFPSYFLHFLSYFVHKNR